MLHLFSKTSVGFTWLWCTGKVWFSCIRYNRYHSGSVLLCLMPGELQPRRCLKAPAVSWVCVHPAKGVGSCSGLENPAHGLAMQCIKPDGHVFITPIDCTLITLAGGVCILQQMSIYALSTVLLMNFCIARKPDGHVSIHQLRLACAFIASVHSQRMFQVVDSM